MGKKNKNKKSKQIKSIPNLGGSNAPKGPTKLRFSPTAWAKLIYLRDIGDSEVGGFGVSAKDDLFYVDDIILPKQECTMASVEFDDESVADMMDDMLTQGFEPREFMRIWIHTHPANSASPSKTDEETFATAFGSCDWSVMMILANGGDTYCRLRVNNGSVAAEFEIPITIDYESYEFPGSEFAEWMNEYNKNVKIDRFYSSYLSAGKGAFHKRFNADGSVTEFPGYNGSQVGYHHREDDAPVVVWDMGDQDDDDDDLPSKLLSSFCSEDIISDFDIDEASVAALKEEGLEDVMDILTPNQSLLLDNMDPGDRKYYLDSLKRKYKIGD